MTPRSCDGSGRLVINDERPTCPDCGQTVPAKRLAGAIYRVAVHPEASK